MVYILVRINRLTIVLSGKKVSSHFPLRIGNVGSSGGQGARDVRGGKLVIHSSLSIPPLAYITRI